MSKTQGNVTNRSLADVIGFSVMVGCGETYLIPLALHLGLNADDSGVLGAVPMCIGAVLQFMYFRLASTGLSNRLKVTALAFLQATSLIAILGAFFVGTEQLLLAYLCVASAAYWFFGFTAGPLWNVWITKLIRQEDRVAFFSKRLMISQVALLACFLASGGLLQYCQVNDLTSVGFAIVFMVAALARYYSTYSLWKHPDPPVSQVEGQNRSRESDNLEKSKWPIIFFLFATYLSVYIAAPFFTAYMLDELSLTYSEFAIITASLVVSRIFFGRYISSNIRHHGILPVLLTGSLGIVALPVLWLVSDNFLYLILLQVVAGIAWGCFDLSLNLYLIETWTEASRTRILSWTNLVTASAMASGALLGTLLMQTEARYALIFAVSSAARLIPILAISMLGANIKPSRDILLRIIAIRPWGGIMVRPILRPRNPPDPDGPGIEQRDPPQNGSKAKTGS